MCFANDIEHETNKNPTKYAGLNYFQYALVCFTMKMHKTITFLILKENPETMQKGDHGPLPNMFLLSYRTISLSRRFRRYLFFSGRTARLAGWAYSSIYG
jgi:hypothetical protein